MPAFCSAATASNARDGGKDAQQHEVRGEVRGKRCKRREAAAFLLAMQAFARGVVDQQHAPGFGDGLSCQQRGDRRRLLGVLFHAASAVDDQAPVIESMDADARPCAAVQRFRNVFRGGVSAGYVGVGCSYGEGQLRARTQPRVGARGFVYVDVDLLFRAECRLQLFDVAVVMRAC